jgi:hypothetical protein
MVAIAVGVFVFVPEKTRKAWQQQQQSQNSPPLGVHIIKITGPACSNYDTTKRFSTILRDDQDAAMRFLEQQIRLGQCSMLYKGSKVRVEQMGWDTRCVAPMGSIDPCK